MIKKMISIDNLAVFQGFNWDEEVRDSAGNIQEFKDINIIYGRNYSGKTTLSRILRAMETGVLSDKFQRPSFRVIFSDGAQATQDAFTDHDKNIRVFNEDFVRENLQFITNPDGSIEPFAILGDDNNKIEKEIELLESKLGSKTEGKETGIYAQHVQNIKNFRTAKRCCKVSPEIDFQ
jgi:wobble nucleotide-excising tRNase